MIYMMIQIYMIWLECEDFRGWLYFQGLGNAMICFLLTSLPWGTGSACPKSEWAPPLVFFVYFSQVHCQKPMQARFEIMLVVASSSCWCRNTADMCVEGVCFHFCDRKVGHLTFPLAVNSFPRFMIFGSYMVLLVIFTGPYHIVLFHPISLVSHRFPKWFMSSFSPSGQNPTSFRSILRHRPRSACHSLIRRDDLWLWSSRTSSTFQARARRARRAGYFFLARF
jgi:hypothetical protein